VSCLEGAACGDVCRFVAAATRVGRRAAYVLPDVGGTFAGTHCPSFVRCAGTTTSPGAAGAALAAMASEQATMSGLAFRIPTATAMDAVVSLGERRIDSVYVPYRSQNEKAVAQPGTPSRRRGTATRTVRRCGWTARVTSLTSALVATVRAASFPT